MRVLLIEDDQATAGYIETILKREDFVCDCTDLGEDGLEIAKLYDYDVIILDLMLPDIGGYDVLRRLRTARVKTPVLILSGLSETHRKIKGLKIGADDYLTKPFDHKELIARIQAIVRRSQGHSAPIIKFGKLSVNIEFHAVAFDGRSIQLTRKEYALLELFALRRGTVVNKDTMLNHLYGGIEEPEHKVVDVFVCKLRKKLATASGGVNYIRTIWGRGYVLVDPENNGALSAVA